eukprot:995181-Pleurochrysis_carterae.AAC.1
MLLIHKRRRFRSGHVYIIATQLAARDRGATRERRRRDLGFGNISDDTTRHRGGTAQQEELVQSAELDGDAHI